MPKLSSVDAEALFRAYERALSALSEAETIVMGMEPESERTAFLTAHSWVVTAIVSDLRAPLLRQYPNLDEEVPTGAANTSVTDDEQQFIDRLSLDQIEMIDRHLLAGCTESWRKVAMVVGNLLMGGFAELEGVPLGFYVQRVQALAAAGHLVAQGDLNYVRFSEVRLARRVDSVGAES